MNDEAAERSSSSSSSPCASFDESNNDTLQRKTMSLPPLRGQKHPSGRLSIYERREVAWERRRRQIYLQERKRNLSHIEENLTDEDMKELKGSIELGFGFNEEEGQQLCNTLPALDLYFAVNRQLSPTPISSPQSARSLQSLDSPGKIDSDPWKICTPGENPQQVKAKLRHWAQAVACSLMQYPV